MLMSVLVTAHFTVAFCRSPAGDTPADEPSQPLVWLTLADYPEALCVHGGKHMASVHV